MITGPESEDQKAGGPPPTYAEVAARAAQSPPPQTPPHLNLSSPPPPHAQASYPHPNSSPNHPYPNPYAGPIPTSPPPRTYGPTPLHAAQTETGGVLPYYDARSPWAMSAAASRAKWRFLGALFWGCVIWLALGSIVGGLVDDRGRRRRGGSWAVA
ncbi:hypothetical protein K439DRAFT_1400704 [Ramaria rubella]|nr:hypothetical protein K439DRAFT_1400704 [Ramaria rubella]